MCAKCQRVVGQRHTFGTFIPNMALVSHSAFLADCCSRNKFFLVIFNSILLLHYVNCILVHNSVLWPRQGRTNVPVPIPVLLSLSMQEKSVKRGHSDKF